MFRLANILLAVLSVALLSINAQELITCPQRPAVGNAAVTFAGNCICCQATIDNTGGVSQRLYTCQTVQATCDTTPANTLQCSTNNCIFAVPSTSFATSVKYTWIGGGLISALALTVSSYLI